MRKPKENIKIFQSRLDQLKQPLLGKALILTSYPEAIRNGSVPHPYRQDSNLYYLTGFEEPETIFIYRPGLNPEKVMFVREKNPERETWDGFRFGPEGVVKDFEMDQAFVIDDFPKIAPKLLNEAEAVYYRMNKNPKFDSWMNQVLLDQKVLTGRSGRGILPILDPENLMSEFRVIKSGYEVDLMRKAAELSAKAHIEAMKFTKPGVNESHIQAVLNYHFLMNGASREGYNYIVAAGNNATTLHYNFNDQICQDKDLLLIDAGGEYLYYTADITRTFPINGKFTDEQAAVYQGVLNVQKQIINEIKPGVPFKRFHEMGAELLIDLMFSLGLLHGRKDDALASGEYKKYYPHGIGHFLGMDVHDVGLYIKNGEARCIEENMVFTVEPGLYIPAHDTSAPSRLRGIGVRIEDNIRVTTNGFENLTKLAPKEISEIESIVGSA
ncbi:MAG: aminopeptidase P family protein [Pseudobdellovibrionaceae bacterium]